MTSIIFQKSVFFVSRLDVYGDGDIIARRKKIRVISEAGPCASLGVLGLNPCVSASLSKRQSDNEVSTVVEGVAF